MRQWGEKPALRRLAACLFGGFVLCLMIGNQEGSQNDFGISFSKATATPRLITFLLLGFVGFLVMTFWRLVQPYIRQPGAATVGIGLIAIFAGMTLMKWYDPVGKLGSVSNEVSHSHNAPPLVSFFFSPVAWVLLAVGLIVSGAAVATRRAVLTYASAVYGVAAAVIIFIAHAQLVNYAGGIDHTLGVYSTSAGYLILALSGVIAWQCSDVEVADPMGAVERALGWRPGFVMVAGAVVVGGLAFFEAAWFAPLQLNAGFHSTDNDFKRYHLAHVDVTYLKVFGVALFVISVVLGAVVLLGAIGRLRPRPQLALPALGLALFGGLAIVVNYIGLAAPYLGWLGLALFAAGSVLGVVGTLRRSVPVALAASAIGFGGVVLTFVTLDRITVVGAKAAVQYGATWDNLGAGGWLACGTFSLLAAGGLVAALAAREPANRKAVVSSDQIAGASGSAITSTLIPVSIAVMLFYPPTLPLNWQNVVTTQIAVFLLLAVGLNVVVGWAGLLDLGYIAFYGIGSYTTAYFTSSLPVKPPSWLHMTPLAAIPFAIVACLIAGVLIGAPTLRLRGDYLAIVTLGFGEIMQLVAINADKLTGGPVGPNVPPPVLKAGQLHVTWGLDNLPYWYLLIALLGIVVVLFYRLEGSRTGRAWAAIREDEVAAQASGVRTTRLKLLAFAVGASTSGVAGVFFASQIGYFDPSAFTLQNSILIVAFVVFGGMGSLQGAIAGAAALTWLPYFLQSQVPLPDSQMWIGALVMIMMIFRPAGLIPAKRRRAELAGLGHADSAEVTAVPAAGAM